jgi:hypothetical protein
MHTHTHTRVHGKRIMPALPACAHRTARVRTHPPHGSWPAHVSTVQHTRLRTHTSIACSALHLRPHHAHHHARPNARTCSCGYHRIRCLGELEALSGQEPVPAGVNQRRNSFRQVRANASSSLFLSSHCSGGCSWPALLLRCGQQTTKRSVFDVDQC